MKSISELIDLTNKRVLVRVDFNVPVDGDGNITESFRILSHKPTISYLMERGANVALVSHLDSGDSFAKMIPQIQKILDLPIHLFPLTEESLVVGENLILLDNIRHYPREKENDDIFAKELAEDFDYYVNDAFSVSHRKHASVSVITQFLPSYAGFLIEKETRELKRVIDTPAEGKILVLGGAKISTKLPVIKNFLDKADQILIGGAIANDFLEAQGIDVGSSVVDDSVEPDIQSEKIILPFDVIISNDKKTGVVSELKNLDKDFWILDIGPETIEKFVQIIKSASMVVWNGPMGLFEVKEFSKGTQKIVEAMTEVQVSIAGGGDSLAAATELGVLDKFSFVSTGGGAMLDFLAGSRLPGLEALGYYE